MALARRATEAAKEPPRGPAPEPSRAPAQAPDVVTAREPAVTLVREPAAVRSAPPRLAALPTEALSARSRPSATPPLYRRWWFWGIVGVAAAGAVAAAVLSTQPWDANLPPGAPIHDPKF